MLTAISFGTQSVRSRLIVNRWNCLKRPILVAGLASVAACGSGDQDMLPAPLLFVVDGTTQVRIVDANDDCSYDLYVADAHGSRQKIPLGGSRTHVFSSTSTANNFVYTCTLPPEHDGQGIPAESRKSRAARLPTFSPTILPLGPLSIDDFNGDGIYEVLGSFGTRGAPIPASVEWLGLGRMRRDARFADFDNDGYLDAITNVYSEPAPGDATYSAFAQLYWGVPGSRFQEDAVFGSYQYTGHGETLVVADFDNDGYVDILNPQYTIPNSPNIYSRNLLFRNNGDRSFTELSLSSGVGTALVVPEGAQAVDIDSDGLIDIYVGGSLFINTGNFGFQDVTLAVGLPGVFEEGAKFYDHDLDGDLDFIIHNPELKARLFLNDDGYFQEAPSSIFPDEFFSSSFGLNLGDFNGDGFDDLMLAGGKTPANLNYAPRLYLNLDGRFVRQPFLAEGTEWSDLVSFADLNNDGSLDLVVRYGTLKIMLNDNVPLHRVELDVLRDGQRNQFGRVVRVYYPDGRAKAMVVDGGSGYLSNQPYTLLIPNDQGVSLTFEILCGDRTITFAAVSGHFSKDCATGD